MHKMKITYIVSGIHKSLEFEWAAKYLSDYFEMEFILLHSAQETELSKYLDSISVKHHFVKYKSKRDLLSAFIKTVCILVRTRPSLVNAHLFEASLIGLSAAYLTRIEHRIYTRHHSDLHHVYFPKAVKYDRFCNLLAQHIIAVSDVVKEVLVEKEGVDKGKISVIHHGIELEKFRNRNVELINALRTKYALHECYPIVGVISRYTEWKGIQYIIPAFKELVEQYPNACLVLANAKGDYKSEIRTLLAQIDGRNYREIEFESEIGSLYHCFHLFTHVPVSPSCEAFGQTYIEAMAAGIPCVFTRSGIANEILKDMENACVVGYRDSNSIKTAYLKILTNKELASKISANAIDTAEEFGVEKKFKAIRDVFSKLMVS